MGCRGKNVEKGVREGKESRNFPFPSFFLFSNFSFSTRIFDPFSSSAISPKTYITFFFMFISPIVVDPTFWYESGSDPDPALFVIGFQDAKKNKFFSDLACFLLFEGTFTSVFKDKKVIKRSQNSRNQGFSYFICLMMEGSGSGRPTNIRTLRSGSRTLLSPFQFFFFF